MRTVKTASGAQAVQIVHNGLSTAYDALGFAEAADGDEVFRQLV